MRVLVAAVGKPGRLLAPAIAEYEQRAARYWRFDSIEVREEKAGGGRTDAQVRAAEAARLLDKVPADHELIALTREGDAWHSTRLARYLQTLAVGASAGVTFVVGGAYGLDAALLERATRRLSLAAGTLPHDLARLVLTEQIYRAGTILRGEPYHKAADA